MSALGRGCVKTHFARTSRQIDLSERAVFNYFQGRKGQTTPQTEIASRFHTASTHSRPTVLSKAVVQRTGNHRSGKVKAKVEPLPNWLLTAIFPPCSSMNFLEMASPSPVPSTFFAAV